MDKQMLTPILEQLTSHAVALPDEVNAKVRAIRTKLQNVPASELEQTTDMVVSSPAGEQPFDPSNIAYMFDELYDDLDDFLATTGNDQSTLHSVRDQLRGMLDESERDFP